MDVNLDHLATAEPSAALANSESTVDARVVLLTHYIPLYQVRVFQELAKRVGELRILLSTPMEPNRHFAPDWTDLHVAVQKGWTLRRRWRHHHGFQDDLFVHVPTDTLAQLRRLKPDVILSHELGVRSMLSALYRRRHRASRLLLMTFMSEHTEQGRGKLRGVLRRRLLRQADGVTYNGPSCHRYLKSLGVPSERLHLFPYAADDRWTGGTAERTTEEAVRERLVCVGQLSERKGCRQLVQQLASYCQQHSNRRFELLMVGSGPLSDELEQFPRPANFALRLLGNLAPQELAQLYPTCGAAIHPTLADEWLMVVNESLQAGLPFIGSCYAQAVETLIRDDVNGWVFDPLQSGDLSAKLDRYFALSPQQVTEMRKAAQASVRQRTPQWSAECLVQAIKQVTS